MKRELYKEENIQLVSFCRGAPAQQSHKFVTFQFHKLCIKQSYFVDIYINITNY
jgi:hypothetical protein